MKARVFKWRNGLAVRIPKRAAELAMLDESDRVEIEVVGERQLRVRRDRTIPTLAELVAQITPSNRYPEL